MAHPAANFPAEEEEEIIDVPEDEKNRDKFYQARVKRNVDGVWFSGIVQDIEMGATTKEKLYRLRYDDGDLEHLTLPEVKEAAEAYEKENKANDKDVVMKSPAKSPAKSSPAKTAAAAPKEEEAAEEAEDEEAEDEAEGEEEEEE